jgi:periplasmic protein TonB
MRTRTFVVSFVVHALLIGAAMVVRIFATTELPDPPRGSTFMIATPAVPEVPPPPQPAVHEPAAHPVDVNAAPVVEPKSLEPELRDVPARAPLGLTVIPGGSGDLPDGIIGPAPPPPAPRVVEQPPAPVRPGGIVRAPQKVHHVAPEYPAIARSARVSGIVIVEALIGEDGSVRDVKVMQSVPLLDAAAVTAVRQWRFTPTLLNGVPVQVIMSVTVSFNLN